MSSKITYHQQMSYCGKPRCRKCREGTGHGPYWYAYQTVEGRTTRTYIGKQLPIDAQTMMEEPHVLPSQRMSEIEQSAIRIYVLGYFRIERRVEQQWQVVTDAIWRRQSVRVLLAFLICHPGRKVSRTQLMEVLWPKDDRESAANQLNRTIRHLCKVLGDSQESLLRTEGEFLIFAQQSRIWIDADEFEELLAQRDESQRERVLQEAEDLYRGDFLPGRWQGSIHLARRQSLRRIWIGLLLELVDRKIAQGVTSGAIEILDRLLANDSTNEDATQRLMIVLVRLKRRGEALQVYHQLIKKLRRENRTGPSEKTRALYEMVQRGDEIPIGDIEASKSTVTVETPFVDVYISKEIIGRSQQNPLVGREQEIQMLRTALLDVEQIEQEQIVKQRFAIGIPFDTLRRPQWVVLQGEAGIGKTRLAEEIGREAQQHQWTVIWNQVYAQESRGAYSMWAEVVRKVLRAKAGAISLRYISAPETVSLQPLTMLVPELNEIVPQAEQEQISSLQLRPEQEQQRLWEAVCNLLVMASENMPLLIVLDDFHLADASSIELLSYVVRHLYGYPILLVGTCRETEISTPQQAIMAHMQRERSGMILHIGPLTREQIKNLISGMSNTPESVVQHIQTQAAGNPLFAEELACTTSETLPQTIHAAFESRVSRLSHACQQMLEHAAVLGGAFDFQVISYTVAVDEDTVLDLLEEALRSKVLTEEGIGTRVIYHFWHPLLVNYLSHRISALRRARLHQRIAEVLQHIHFGREEEIAAIITHHLVNGGAESSQIAHYAELAGDRAYSLSAYPDAEQHYRIALEYLDTGSDKQPRLAYLLERLGECTRFQGKNEEARRFYEQVLDARSQNRTFVSRADELQDAQIDALLWCAIGLTWYNIGNNIQALQCYECGAQTLNDARITDGPAWASIRRQQSHVNWREGNYDEARRAAHEALKLFERSLKQQKDSIEKISRLTYTRRTLAGDIVNIGRIHALLGIIAASSRQCEDALTHLNIALTLYEQHASQREIAIVCCNLGDVHLRKAEHSQAQAFFRRSLNLAERIGETPLVSVIFNNLGILAARSGDLAEAETCYRRGLALAEQVNDHVSVSILNAYLTTILQEQGRSEDAKRCVLKALSISRSMKIAPCIGFGLVALGNMRITQAITIDVDETKDKFVQRKVVRSLKHAKITLRRALALEGMEAETRTEAQLTLAQVMLLLGEAQAALGLATQTLEDARQFELTWLIARSQRLLGSILATKGEYEQASRYFEQALYTFRQSSMRLEVGHTLYQYGLVLLQQSIQVEKEYQRGLAQIRQAHHIFVECNAVIYVKCIEDHMMKYDKFA